ATAVIYTLSLHDALPILGGAGGVVEEMVAAAVHEGGDEGEQHGEACVHERLLDGGIVWGGDILSMRRRHGRHGRGTQRVVESERSEEHTSELQSLRHLVC